MYTLLGAARGDVLRGAERSGCELSTRLPIIDSPMICKSAAYDDVRVIRTSGRECSMAQHGQLCSEIEVSTSADDAAGADRGHDELGRYMSKRPTGLTRFSISKSMDSR